MTRVDFYVLPDDSGRGGADAMLRIACRLCDKAVSAGQRVYLHTQDPAVADSLDSMLWTLRQGSFIAHERAEAVLSPPWPDALIGTAEPPAGFDGVLIPLGAELPPFYERFQRVLELVWGDAALRSAKRARFRFYRERGHALDSHEIEP